MSTMDYDHLSDEYLESLERTRINVEREKQEWAAKNLPKTLDEAIIEMDSNKESQPRPYTIDEQRYIESAPKTMDEAMARIGERDYLSATERTYYEGMSPIDPDMYRYETTGTTQEDLAKIVNEMSRMEISVSTDPEVMSEKLDQLMTEPETISKVMETRMRKTSDFLYGWGSYDKDHVYTDLAMISMLVSKGYDFSNFKVDLSTQVGAEPDIVNLEGLLEYYDLGLIGKKSEGKNTQIPNPLNPQEIVPAESLVADLKTASTQLQAESSRAY